MSRIKKHESNPDSLDRVDKNYNQDDIANFEKLMNFPPMSAVASKPAGSPDDGSTAYSDNDIQAFAKLIAQVDGSKGAHRRRVVNAGDWSLDGYSASDNGHFDELSAALEDRVRAIPTSSNQHQTTPGLDVTGYSESDRQAFRRLMVSRLGADDPPGEEREFRESPGAGATGFIKIIDFDKERTREKSKARRDRADIKIRYFD